MSADVVYLSDGRNTTQATAHWYQDPPPGPSNLRIEQTLGEGAFSTVVKATYLGKEWAIKQTIKKKDAEFIQCEADLLAFLNKQERRENQEYLVQAVALLVQQHNPMLVMKLYEGGDLEARVTRTKGGLSLESSLRILTQLLKALSFLKEQGVVHRDIKLPNIFIEYGDIVKLGDLGLAMRLGDEKKAAMCCGTPLSMSPEIVEKIRSRDAVCPYGSASDVWATGCAIFNIFSGRELFQVHSRENWNSVLLNQQKGLPTNLRIMLNEVYRRKNPSSPFDYLRFTGALSKMLELDPAERLTPEEGEACLIGQEPFVLIEDEDLPPKIEEESTEKDTSEKWESFVFVERGSLPSAEEGNSK